MRNLKPLPPEVQEVMVKGQQIYKKKGMVCCSVVLGDSVLTMQFKRLAKEQGIDAFERYVDTSSTANWTDAAVARVKDWKDPGWTVKSS